MEITELIVGWLFYLVCKHCCRKRNSNAWIQQRKSKGTSSWGLLSPGCKFVWWTTGICVKVQGLHGMLFHHVVALLHKGNRIQINKCMDVKTSDRFDKFERKAEKDIVMWQFRGPDDFQIFLLHRLSRNLLGLCSLTAKTVLNAPRLHRIFQFNGSKLDKKHRTRHTISVQKSWGVTSQSLNASPSTF